MISKIFLKSQKLIVLHYMSDSSTFVSNILYMTFWYEIIFKVC